MNYKKIKRVGELKRAKKLKLIKHNTPLPLWYLDDPGIRACVKWEAENMYPHNMQLLEPGTGDVGINKHRTLYHKSPSDIVDEAYREVCEILAWPSISDYIDSKLLLLGTDIGNGESQTCDSTIRARPTPSDNATVKPLSSMEIQTTPDSHRSAIDLFGATVKVK